jgi:hypothetical protein
MAGRTMGKRHQDDVRTKIQSSQIINRLMSAFNGTIELTQTQVNIGKALLDKALPDLKAIEHTGAGDNGELLINTIERVIIDNATDTDTTGI